MAKVGRSMMGTHEVLEAVRRAASKKPGGVDAFDVAKELNGSPDIAHLAKTLGDLAGGGSIRWVAPDPDATRRRYLPK